MVQTWWHEALNKYAMKNNKSIFNVAINYYMSSIFLHQEDLKGVTAQEWLFSSTTKWTSGAKPPPPNLKLEYSLHKHNEMQSRPVMFKGVEAAHRNHEPEVMWVPSSNHPDWSQCQSFLISVGQTLPLVFIEAADFCICWGQKETKQIRRTLLISAQHCSYLF